MSDERRKFPARPSRLTPTQVRAVADQRLQDAGCLYSTRLRRHANGVIYLSGLAVDCLLKAKLLEKHANIRDAEPARLDASARQVWQLIYRTHDLDAMLARLPELETMLIRADPRGSTRYLVTLKAICANWSIRTRYNTRQASTDEVDAMFGGVKELRPWLA